MWTPSTKHLYGLTKTFGTRVYLTEDERQAIHQQLDAEAEAARKDHDYEDASESHWKSHRSRREG